jgi:hypothetical protein
MGRGLQKRLICEWTFSASNMFGSSGRQGIESEVYPLHLFACVRSETIDPERNESDSIFTGKS